MVQNLGGEKQWEHDFLQKNKRNSTEVQDEFRDAPAQVHAD